MFKMRIILKITSIFCLPSVDCKKKALGIESHNRDDKMKVFLLSILIVYKYVLTNDDQGERA